MLLWRLDVERSRCVSGSKDTSKKLQKPQRNSMLKNLILPPHVFSVQVKSGACYITGQWWRVQNKTKET